MVKLLAVRNYSEHGMLVAVVNAMMRLAGGLFCRPANKVALLSLRLATCQCFSGYLLTKASRFGIWTFASVSLFMTSFSPMILLSAST